MGRILVACVGNVLRRDDGFGQAVASRLQRVGGLPERVALLEVGIGGIELLHELMGGCEGLVVVDAVDRDVEPGTVFVIEPDVPEAEHVPDVHLANPARVLSLAKSLGCLPPRVLLVGCQPADTEELEQRLSRPVDRAVREAAATVEEIVSGWLGAGLGAYNRSDEGRRGG